MKKLLAGLSKPRDDPNSLLGKTVQIDKYVVRCEESIGEGGYASIYKAKEVSSGQTFALKHIRLTPGEEVVNETMREGQIMARLRQHPNILKMHAMAFAGTQGKETDAFMLLDYCPTTLLDLMQRTAFQLDDFLIYETFSEVCAGVAHMHHFNPSYAHRDIKAENVLKNSSGRWVLCDFGSCTERAQTYETPAEIAMEEEVIRRTTTPAYRAPEMWDLMSRHRIDTKVDIWALGVLLYVLCFGKLPFQGGSKLEVLFGKYEIPPGRNPVLCDLIRALLVPDPAERPDISAVLSRLEVVKTSLVSGFAPPPTAALAPHPHAAASSPPVSSKPIGPVQSLPPSFAPGPGLHLQRVSMGKPAGGSGPAPSAGASLLSASTSPALGNSGGAAISTLGRVSQGPGQGGTPTTTLQYSLPSAPPNSATQSPAPHKAPVTGTLIDVTSPEAPAPPPITLAEQQVSLLGAVGPDASSGPVPSLPGHRHKKTRSKTAFDAVFAVDASPQQPPPSPPPAAPGQHHQHHSTDSGGVAASGQPSTFEPDWGEDTPDWSRAASAPCRNSEFAPAPTSAATSSPSFTPRAQARKPPAHSRHVSMPDSTLSGIAEEITGGVQGSGTSSVSGWGGTGEVELMRVQLKGLTASQNALAARVKSLEEIVAQQARIIQALQAGKSVAAAGAPPHDAPAWSTFDPTPSPTRAGAGTTS